MARVTVEDCLLNVRNRFELVMLASKRARQLMRGSSEPKVAWENDKATVVALREIAMGYTDFSDAHHIEHPVQKAVVQNNNEIADEDDDSDLDTDTAKTSETAAHTDDEASAHEVTTSSDDHQDSE